MSRPKPFILAILDGWGIADDTESTDANAIAQANTPTWDRLWEHHPHCLLHGSGTAVGLPHQHMGNSEVGHLNIGAGRVIRQDFLRINKTIEDQSFSTNTVLREALDDVRDNNKALHVLGLLSPGGVHSHEDQIIALLDMALANGIKKLYLHAFLDGRDTPPKSALESLQRIQKLFDEQNEGHIVSVIGRYYAMDRDNRWERVQSAYELICEGKATYHAEKAIDALQQAYAREETDEFVQATALYKANEKPITINDGDSIIFMNFRADRARELTRAFTENAFDAFDAFDRKRLPQLNHFVTLTEYASNLNVTVAFPPERYHNVLGDYLSQQGCKQLRIAETEKYAHVTFFFNGGVEEPFDGEDRVLIPSPSVPTYDQKPEMNAYEVTEKIIEAIHAQEYDVIICNFANPDMVGHTGDLAATIKAIETIDDCLRLMTDALNATGGEALITADHGNAERLFDPKTQQAHTAHTNNPVPLLYIGRKARFHVEEGALSDIAPTLLYLMSLTQPSEMTGKSLIMLD